MDPNQESVNQGSQPGADNKEQVSEYNRLRELERKLEKTTENYNASKQELDEIKKQREDLKKMRDDIEALSKKPQNDDEFFRQAAQEYGYFDEEGKPDIDAVKRQARMNAEMINSYTKPIIDRIELKLEKMERKELLRELPEYDIYKEDIDKIINNELNNTNIPQDQKIKIAYEMAKGRNIRKEYIPDQTKPNATQSSVNSNGSFNKNDKSFNQEEKKIAEEAKKQGLDPQKIIERRRRMQNGDFNG